MILMKILYDDIICDYGQKFQITAAKFCCTEFSYIGDSNIKIGYTACDAFMIYVGDSSTKQLINMDIDDNYV